MKLFKALPDQTLLIAFSFFWLCSIWEGISNTNQWVNKLPRSLQTLGSFQTTIWLVLDSLVNLQTIQFLTVSSIQNVLIFSYFAEKFTEPDVVSVWQPCVHSVLSPRRAFICDPPYWYSNIRVWDQSPPILQRGKF